MELTTLQIARRVLAVLLIMLAFVGSLLILLPWMHLGLLLVLTSLVGTVTMLLLLVEWVWTPGSRRSEPEPTWEDDVWR